MIKTKTRDIGIAFAILAGLVFLFCALTKLVATFTPLAVYLHDLWLFDSEPQYMQVDEFCSIIEILALATLTAICCSRKRTNALIAPFLAIGFVSVKACIDSVYYTVVNVIHNKLDIFGLLVTVFTFISTVFVLLALLSFTIQICTNTRYEKGIVSQVFLAVFAFFAVIFSALAYFPALTADVLGIFVEGKLAMITSGLGGFSEVLLVPFINNVAKFAFSGGAFFLAMWLVFRPQTIEVVIESKEEKKARREAEKIAKAEKSAAKVAEKEKMASEKAAKKAVKKQKSVAEVSNESDNTEIESTEAESVSEYDPMEDVAGEPESAQETDITV